MAAAAEVPKTESTLLLELPSSNDPGVFPRGLLPGGERVLFETRPSLVGLYIGRLVLLGLLLFVWINVSLEIVTNPAGWFFVALTLFAIIYYILLWRSTAYALTDLRVIRLSGLRRSNFIDAQYDQVQNLSLEPGFSGGIKFDATPPRAPSRLLVGRKYAKTVYWNALPEAARVYNFVQKAFALHEHQAHREGLREALLARLRADRFPCAYCRTLVDIKTVDYASPKCPNCGAPLVDAMA